MYSPISKRLSSSVISPLSVSPIRDAGDFPGTFDEFESSSRPNTNTTDPSLIISLQQLEELTSQHEQLQRNYNDINKENIEYQRRIDDLQHGQENAKNDELIRRKNNRDQISQLKCKLIECEKLIKKLKIENNEMKKQNTKYKASLNKMHNSEINDIANKLFTLINANICSCYDRNNVKKTESQHHINEATIMHDDEKFNENNNDSNGIVRELLKENKNEENEESNKFNAKKWQYFNALSTTIIVVLMCIVEC